MAREQFIHGVISPQMRLLRKQPESLEAALALASQCMDRMCILRQASPFCHWRTLRRCRDLMLIFKGYNFLIENSSPPAALPSEGSYTLQKLGAQ